MTRESPPGHKEPQQAIRELLHKSACTPCTRGRFRAHTVTHSLSPRARMHFSSATNCTLFVNEPEVFTNKRPLHPISLCVDARAPFDFRFRFVCIDSLPCLHWWLRWLFSYRFMRLMLPLRAFEASLRELLNRWRFPIFISDSCNLNYKYVHFHDIGSGVTA